MSPSRRFGQGLPPFGGVGAGLRRRCREVPALRWSAYRRGAGPERHRAGARPGRPAGRVGARGARRQENQRRQPMRTWLFFSGLFWKTLIWALLISFFAKSLVNLLIEPISQPIIIRNLQGQIFPFPPGRIAITHLEHWHEGWPDYTEGIVGKTASFVGEFIERFVEYNNVELVLWIGIWTLIILLAAGKTIGVDKDDLPAIYVGMGLMFAGGISNQGEIAMLNHSTDFIFLRLNDTSSRIAVANIADVMLLFGFLIFLLGDPIYRKYRELNVTASVPD